MQTKLVKLAVLFVVTSLLASCANGPTTATTEERKFDRKKSSMYAR